MTYPPAFQHLLDAYGFPPETTKQMIVDVLEEEIEYIKQPRASRTDADPIVRYWMWRRANEISESIT